MFVRRRVGVSRIEQHPAAVARFVWAASLMVGIVIAVTGCGPTVTLGEPTTTAVPVVHTESVTLRVDVKPRGATVLVDAEHCGTTPLTLTLSPGQHTVRVEKDGYQALEQSLVLSAGEWATVDGSLVDVSLPTVAIQLLPKRPHAGQQVAIYVTAYDNVAVARLELWIDGQRVLEEVGAAATYCWDLPLDTMGQHVVMSRAYDLTGNAVTLEQPLVVAAPLPTVTATPVPSPTTTSSPSPSPSSSPTVTPLPTATPTPTSVPAANVYYETTLTIATYPYADHLWQETDVRYGVPLWRLERAEYEADHPTPMPQTYRALVVENEYLQLTFLPELGGRLYRCIYKPTGQNIFYQNPVIKPSHWGALAPAEHNWWLAAGGMEWALPVHEHGYEFGVPWNYSVQATSRGITVVLWDADIGDRLRFEVQVVLPPRRAAFILRPRLMNPLPGDVRVQLWLNAMLTLGSHTIAPETEFVLPDGSIVVHSTGDVALATSGEAMTWPIYGGRDLSRYANWHQWLGVFVQQPEQGFVGAYNHATRLGVARIFSPQETPGVKLFAFGSDFGDRGHYTDDDSQYFELWGGPNRSFWSADDVLLPAGGEIAWEETWLPFADIGGLTYANEVATLHLERGAGQIDLGLSVSMAIQGLIRFMDGEGESIWEQAVDLLPASPLRQQVVLPENLAADAKLRLQLVNQGGEVLLDYSLKD